MTVASQAGRLTFRYGGNEAALEHWHFDTFRVVWDTLRVVWDTLRVVWPDRMRARALATFALDARGRPATLDVARLTTFRRAAGP